jgi:hypothetical protein
MFRNSISVVTALGVRITRLTLTSLADKFLLVDLTDSISLLAEKLMCGSAKRLAETKVNLATSVWALTCIPKYLVGRADVLNSEFYC